jgi:hypothetical protein
LTTARAEQFKEFLVETAYKLTAACGGTPPAGAGKGGRKKSAGRTASAA